jgi:hypothetical protein
MNIGKFIFKFSNHNKLSKSEKKYTI